MIQELELTPQQFSNVVNMFFVGYIIAQLPGTLFLRIVGPPIQLGTACVLWGVFTIVQVKIRNYSDLMGLRFLIGLCEGFGQGAVFCKSTVLSATVVSPFFSGSTLYPVKF